MSSSLDSAQTEWLEQLAAMRQAIADLNLPPYIEKTPAYGDDLDIDDDDLSGTVSGEDIWDVISDEYDEEYSSDHLDQYVDDQLVMDLYDQNWLANRCADVARRSSGLTAGVLKEQILAILASDSNGEPERTIEKSAAS